MITWANPADITYGTALGAAQLDATAPVPGTFTYSPAVGTVLKAGAGQLLTVTFSPTDTVHYTSASASATINVGKATPTITWRAPADLIEGTALGAAQLNATASVPGTFAYSPAAETILGVGAGQLLTVTFTPADTADYASTSAAVMINVNKATPPPGTVTDLQNVMNRKQQVTQVSLTFGGGVDPSAAANKANYRLVKQGKHGSFIASKAAMIKIKSVRFDPSTNTVTLIPKKPFALKKPVAVLFAGGRARSYNATGWTIVGNGDGQPRANAIAIHSRRGATPAVVASPSALATTEAVDVLLVQSASDDLTRTRTTAWLKGHR